MRLKSLSVTITTQNINREPPKSGLSQIPVPIDFVSLHLPEVSLASWNSKGIEALEALKDGSCLRSFGDLQQQYGLPSTDLFKFTQIKHLMENLSSKQCNIPTKILTLMQSPPTRMVKGSKMFYD